MSQSDVRTRVQDALSDAFRGGGYGYSYAYVVDIFGDDKGGDVVYSYNDDLKKAPYVISGASCSIDTSKAVDVSPLTTYEVHSDAVGTSEAGARNSKRDMVQLQTIHDSAAKLGAKCGVAEARRVSRATTELKLVESAATFLTEIRAQEAARSNYPILLISPGTGARAHYPAAVLERDGPKVAKKGAFLYWNHPTKAEEAARPEGNLDNLAAILTSDARWDANGAKGPGLYGEAKVMGDYAQKIAERAPHIGLSIRGGGTGDGTFIDGVPVLKSLDYIESVDYVTKAGRGGLALAEAARSAGLAPFDDDEEEDEDGMTPIEATALRESTARLLDRAIRGDARETATEVLADFTLAEAAKKRVVETCVAGALPKTAAGELDRTAFSAVVTAEAKREGAYVARLVGSGRVAGMGAAPANVELTEAQRTEAEARRKREDEEAVSIFESFPGMSPEAAKVAAKGRAA